MKLSNMQHQTIQLNGMHDCYIKINRNYITPCYTPQFGHIKKTKKSNQKNWKLVIEAILAQRKKMSSIKY